jgi:hypothetical protein
MRSFRFVLLLVLIAFAKSATAQQAATPSAQGTALLQQALTALSGGTSITDVTLSGTARCIAGSDDESGTAVLKALVAGASRMDLTLSGVNRSEIRSVDGNNSPIGAWSGPDGVQHAISYHNLSTDSSWFFPALTFRRLANTAGIVGTYVGQETWNGQSVLHVSFSQPASVATASNAAVMQHLTEMDFYLDPTTLFPVALSFSIHPDGNELLDIPVQIQFSNYQNTGGVQTPFHIQKFLNGSLSLDLQVQSAVLNSGLSASEFSVQTAQ